jgi:phospholipid/cholesterol/gamma-HCH transport system substrate-binding protein
MSTEQQPHEPTGTEQQDAGRGIGGQIDRYRNAFIAVIAMILIAAVSGGYILAHERLNLPGWVPVLGKNYFTLKGEFQTAQAVAPGQGQAVTIAGAKIGEIASVDLNHGRATVTMNVTPKYAKHIYRDATMLLRPKTELKDMVVEVNPGTPSAGRLKSSEVLPVSQTAPDINFDEFLASLDAETRAYLQELLAGAGEGLKGNGATFAAVLKRFSPLSHDVAVLTRELNSRQGNIARGIHNFQLLLSAIGGKDTQLAQVVDSSNAVFKVFSEQDANVQKTLRLLPGVLSKTNKNLGKFTTSINVLGPTLKKLHPFASSLASGEEASRPFFKETTPIIKSQIRPFAREVLPVINKIQPASQALAEASPNLATGFQVFNEFFNELAYNPGPSQGGFLFFLDWANHNFNSVISSADANGTLGHTLVYFNCEIVPILSAAAKINPTVRLILGLLNPPSSASKLASGAPACAASTALSSNATAASVKSGGTAHTAAVRARTARAKKASLFGSGISALSSVLAGTGGHR